MYVFFVFFYEAHYLVCRGYVIGLGVTKNIDITMETLFVPTANN